MYIICHNIRFLWLKHLHFHILKKIDKLKLEHQASVTFSAEDLYFYEKDEIEIRRGHKYWFCWRMNGTSLKHRRYMAVILVIKKEYAVHSFTFCGSHGSIGTLWHSLQETFGK
jgi:hypothetical protein